MPPVVWMPTLMYTCAQNAFARVGQIQEAAKSLSSACTVFMCVSELLLEMSIKTQPHERYELYRTRIRELRQEQHVSQEKLGMYISVEQKSISDYERGRTRIPVSALIKIAKFFDVSMDYITGVSDERGHFPKKNGL